MKERDCVVYGVHELHTNCTFISNASTEYNKFLFPHLLRTKHQNNDTRTRTHTHSCTHKRKTNFGRKPENTNKQTLIKFQLRMAFCVVSSKKITQILNGFLSGISFDLGFRLRRIPIYIFCLSQMFMCDVVAMLPKF